MNDAVCASCGKAVAASDQADHLRSDHLGPHYFRLNGRPYRTMQPSMRCADVLRVLELPLNAYLWEVRDGREIDYSHDTAIDLTHQPQLFLEVNQLPETLQTPRKAIERASSAIAPSTHRVPDEETFWLVERRCSPPQYVGTGGGFTTDPLRATRFANERAAHDHWRLMCAFREECRPVEHMFVNKPYD